MAKKTSESEVKRRVGDWLKQLGFNVYDESKKRAFSLDWDGAFKVKHVQRGRRPDLVIKCHMYASEGQHTKNVYIALEIKPGYNHNKVFDGFGQVLNYLNDYCWGARYFIEGESGRSRSIHITAIALATNFSEQGYLFKQESKKFKPKIIEGEREFGPMTFSILKLLGKQRTRILNTLRDLTLIPISQKTFEKSLSKKSRPDVGVLVMNLGKGKPSPVLMISEPPYYWYLYTSKVSTLPTV